jgi:hypothetical protein
MSVMISSILNTWLKGEWAGRRERMACIGPTWIRRGGPYLGYHILAGVPSVTYSQIRYYIITAHVQCTHQQTVGQQTAEHGYDKSYINIHRRAQDPGKEWYLVANAFVEG